MTDYKKLVRALRCKSLSKKCDSCGYGYHLSPDSECNDACHFEQIIADAADAIEALQAELKKTVTQIFGEEQMAWEGRCKDLMKYISDLQAEVERYVRLNTDLLKCNDELREKQTYIDHYGNTWMTSAKDVPTAAYKHGYTDGWDEAMAKMEVQE